MCLPFAIPPQSWNYDLLQPLLVFFGKYIYIYIFFFFCGFDFLSKWAIGMELTSRRFYLPFSQTLIYQFLHVNGKQP